MKNPVVTKHVERGERAANQEEETVRTHDREANRLGRVR